MTQTARAASGALSNLLERSQRAFSGLPINHTLAGWLSRASRGTGACSFRRRVIESDSRGDLHDKRARARTHSSLSDTRAEPSRAAPRREQPARLICWRRRAQIAERLNLAAEAGAAQCAAIRSRRRDVRRSQRTWRRRRQTAPARRPVGQPAETKMLAVYFLSASRRQRRRPIIKRIVRLFVDQLKSDVTLLARGRWAKRSAQTKY